MTEAQQHRNTATSTAASCPPAGSFRYRGEAGFGSRQGSVQDGRNARRLACRARTGAIVAAALMLGFAVGGSLAAEPDQPSLRGLLPLNPTVPEGLGVNIHFTDARPGEMEMLAAGGFTWVRMDLSWSGTEKVKGEYDFRPFERLLESLDKHGLRAMLILDYHNRFYDDGLSPYTDEGRAAFARWAAAAVAKFKGRGVMWEMYNEPNISFWKPRPNPPDYIKLAIEVGKAIRATAPDELYVGPATSKIDMPFLEACFKAGLLDYWDAVTVHPYRRTEPETVVPEYVKLRRAIERHAPAGKHIPIISGEWGYSVAWQHFDADRQARYLARQWLVNLSQSVPLSIWYDWRDDGKDPKEPEHNFGAVRHDYRRDEQPVFEPKPAYRAAQTLTRCLNGLQFNKRLDLGHADDWCLLFAAGDRQALACWTTQRGAPREVVLPTGPGKFQLVSLTGEAVAEREADAAGLRLSLSGDVQYVLPADGSDSLRVAAAWQTAPATISARAGEPIRVALKLRNPLDRPIRVSHSGQPKPATIDKEGTASLAFTSVADPIKGDMICEMKIDGMPTLRQRVGVEITNTVEAAPAALLADRFLLRVHYPSADGLEGRIHWTTDDAPKMAESSTAFRLESGKPGAMIVGPFASPIESEARIGWRLVSGMTALAESAPTVYRRADDFGRYTAETLAAAYDVQFDGDRQVEGRGAVTLEDPKDGPVATGIRSLRIDYRFGAGWKFLQLRPKGRQTPLPGRPKTLLLWVYGDESGNRVRMRVLDSTGQCFQPYGEAVAWRGWRQVPLRLDDENIGYWGGRNDGTIHYPIRLDPLVLIDSTKNANQGKIYVAAPMWIE